ncbi:hypothetical protein Q7P37_009947 [Cladosporium fusiforme]
MQRRFERIYDVVEPVEKYRKAGYHPIHLNDTLNSRYRIVAKLGFGQFSTVWMALDMKLQRHVAMKVLVASSSVESQELTILRRLSHSNLSHPGRNNVVSLLDAFENTGPNGRHLCLVFPLMLSDVSQVTKRDYSRSANYVKVLSIQLVLGLSYLHSCNTVHCDIQPANILLSRRDDLEETTWLNEPESSPVKWRPGVQADDSAPEYLVPSQIPRGMLDDFDEGTLILRIGDLGGAKWQSHDSREKTVTPLGLRAPELLQGSSWGAGIDIWSAACVLYELATNEPLFVLESFYQCADDKVIQNLIHTIDDLHNNTALWQRLMELEDGYTVPINSRSQNTAIIITRQKVNLIFEEFELSPRNEAVIRSSGSRTVILDYNRSRGGTHELQSFAGHAMEWGAANKVEFEVSKTEVLLFSKKRNVLQAAKETVVHIGEHTCTINQGATKWLGFWLDPKLSFKTHFEKRMTSAKGAIQAVANLSKRNGGLSIKLMRRVVVAAVSSVALFGAEVCQARAITGLLKSTPIAFLLKAACLPYSGDILDQRQLHFAVRALSAAQDHPTHQLLPANFDFRELYRHEGATGHPSSVGWTRPDKAHRLFGSRLAQQVSKHVTYDTEHGFDLLERAGTLSAPARCSGDGPSQTLPVKHRYGPDKITLVASAAKAVSFGAAVGWVADNRNKVKSNSLGKYLTTLGAELYAIHMAVEATESLLPDSITRCIEILSGSHQSLSAISKAGYWTTPLVRDIRHHIRLIRERGHQVILSQLPTDGNLERIETVQAAATLAATQQPKVMRSASLTYVVRSTEARWKPATRISKTIGEGKKSVTVRYLQLKSGHAVTGEYLLRTKQARDARRWWCNSSRQTVVHLLMECRKWRRERDVMLRDMHRKKIRISARRDTSDLQLLFGESAAEAVLRFLEHTAVGKRKEDREARVIDEWDMDRLDGSEGAIGEAVERDGG